VTVRPKHFSIALIVVTVVAVTAIPMVAASDHTTLSVGDATVTAGETTTVEVALSAIPSGLSGFNVTVALSNPEIATITDATVDGYTLSETTVSADGSTVRLKGIDAQKQYQSGDGRINLATVTVRGSDTADTDLTVDVDQVDDDDGERIDPVTDTGSVTVEPTDSGNDSGSDTGGRSDEGEPEDGEGQGTSEGVTATDEVPPTATGATTSAEPASDTVTQEADDDSDSGDPQSGETTSGSGPGFGAPVAAVALLAVSLLARLQ